MSMYRRRLMIANALRKSDGNINYPNLIAAWLAAGKTNEDEDRAVLKDLTGNGHDITLNGFAFSEMSGYGGYVQTWLDKTTESDLGKIVVSSNSITFEPTSTSALNVGQIDSCLLQPTEDYIKIKIAGLKTDGTSKLQINIKNYAAFIANYDGVYSIKLESGTRNVFIQGVDNVVILELLPEYPDALVFDGVDDYGICENMPQVNDYTYIIKREILSSQRQMVSVYGNGSYSNILQSYMWFEYEKDDGNVITTSFGNSIDVSKYIPKLISYQTKTNYNGNTIPIKELTEYGTVFHLGGFHGYQCNMAFYSAYLFDRSLTEEEIKAFIRKYIDAEYLLPSEELLILNQGKLNVNKLK